MPTRKKASRPKPVRSTKKTVAFPKPVQLLLQRYPGAFRVLATVLVVFLVFQVLRWFHDSHPQVLAPRIFKVHSMVRVTDNTAAGEFNAWGIAPAGKDRLIVADIGHNRLLL